MTRQINITVLFSVMLCLFLSVPAFAAGLTLQPKSSTAQVGVSLDIPIQLDPEGESVDTARAVIKYDPTLLEATSFSLASPLDMIAPSSLIDDELGVVSWGGFHITNRITAPTVFGVAHFRPLGAGSTTVSLLSSSHIISSGKEIGTAIGDNANIRILEVEPIANQNTDIAASALSPEYNYKIIHSTALCGWVGSLCREPWWTALVAFLTLIGVLVGSYFWHHWHQRNENTL